MKLGPIRIIAYPHCQKPAWHWTTLSGNTVGKRTWTDGWHYAPMEHVLPTVEYCRHCKACYWLAKAEILAEAPADPAALSSHGWSGVEHVTAPSARQYYQAIASGLPETLEQECQLRILAWWRSNDPDRDETVRNIGQAWNFDGREEMSDEQIAELTASRRDNMRALMPFLNGSDSQDLLLKAEVLRELGEFNDSIAILNRITTEKSRYIVQQLHSLCDEADVKVREVVISVVDLQT